MAYCYQAWLALKIAAIQKGMTLYKVQAQPWRRFLTQQLLNPAIKACAA